MQHYEDMNDRLDRLKIDNIITNDIDAWENNKFHKRIYNKLWLVEEQGIPCGPIGTTPTRFPIIIKPIINLYGMSKGFKIINTLEEYKKNLDNGSFWMPFITGKNYTIDLVVDNGKIVSEYAMQSKPNKNGSFSCHSYKPKHKLSDYNKDFLESKMIGYTGLMNVEIINNVIIEAHLRLNGDCYAYDDDFFIQISNMINGEDYMLKKNYHKFYLFPYFVSGSFNKKIDKKSIEKILLKYGINNIRWDELESEYQRNDTRRLLMFKTSYSDKGKYIIDEIDKFLK